MNKSRSVSFLALASLLLIYMPLNAAPAQQLDHKVFSPLIQQPATSAPGCYAQPYGTLVGKILDTNGQPVEGVSAKAELEGYADRLNFGYGPGTDSTGTFTRTLPAGRYKIHFNTYVPTGSVEYYYPQQPTSKSAQWVPVTGGQTTSITALLPQFGKITGTAGSTTAIVVLAADGSFVQYAYHDSYSEAYRTMALVPGIYKIWVLPPSLNSDYPVANDQFYGGAYDFAHAQPITVTAGQVISNVDIPLHRGSMLNIQYTGPIVPSIGATVLYATRLITFGPANDPTLFSYEYQRQSLTKPGGYPQPFYLPAGTYRLKVVGNNVVSNRGIAFGYYKGQTRVGDADLITLPLSSTIPISFPVELAYGSFKGAITSTGLGQGSAGTYDVELYEADTGKFVSSAFYYEGRFANNYYNLQYDKPQPFSTTGIRPGRYKIHFAVKSSYLGFIDNWYPDKTSFDEAEVVTIQQDQVLTNINATLLPCPPYSGPANSASATPPATGATPTDTPAETSTPIPTSTATEQPIAAASSTATDQPTIAPASTTPQSPTPFQTSTPAIPIPTLTSDPTKGSITVVATNTSASPSTAIAEVSSSSTLTFTATSGVLPVITVTDSFPPINLPEVVITITATQSTSVEPIGTAMLTRETPVRSSVITYMPVLIR